MNTRRFITFLYLAFFLAIGAAAGVFFWQTRLEYERQLEVEDAVRTKLVAARERLANQERVLQRLRSDPEYVEAVIRKRLGYARPEEFVFRFEE